MKRIPIWIDCDPGTDDAAALLAAHRLPELEIVGVSAVAGNVCLEKTLRNALALREFMGADFPVYAGAEKPLCRAPLDSSEFHGKEGLGPTSLPLPVTHAEPEPMWDALYAAACRYAGELEVVTLGPLTSLATAIAKYPDLPQKVRRVSLMGGAAVGGNCTPSAEFNIYADPEAAQLVFRSGCKLVMCGLDVTLLAYLTEEELDTIAASGDPGGIFLRDCSRDILKLNVAAGSGGWCVHDAVPVWHLVAPELFTERPAGVYVETQSAKTLGKTVTDLYSDFSFPEKNASVVLGLDRAEFVRRMTAIFGTGA